MCLSGCRAVLARRNKLTKLMLFPGIAKRKTKKKKKTIISGYEYCKS